MYKAMRNDLLFQLAPGIDVQGIDNLANVTAMGDPYDLDYVNNMSILQKKMLRGVRIKAKLVQQAKGNDNTAEGRNIKKMTEDMVKQADALDNAYNQILINKDLAMDSNLLDKLIIVSDQLGTAAHALAVKEDVKQSTAGVADISKALAWKDFGHDVDPAFDQPQFPDDPINVYGLDPRQKSKSTLLLDKNRQYFNSMHINFYKYLRDQQMAARKMYDESDQLIANPRVPAGTDPAK